MKKLTLSRAKELPAATTGDPHPEQPDAGRIVAPGVWPVGAIDRTAYPRRAYELGKSIAAAAGPQA